jgi:hypothetical protein
VAVRADKGDKAGWQAMQAKHPDLPRRENFTPAGRRGQRMRSMAGVARETANGGGMRTFGKSRQELAGARGGCSALAASVEELDGERLALLKELRGREALPRGLERAERRSEGACSKLGSCASQERGFFLQTARREGARFRKRRD